MPKKVAAQRALLLSSAVISYPAQPRATTIPLVWHCMRHPHGYCCAGLFSIWRPNSIAPSSRPRHEPRVLMHNMPTPISQLQFRMLRPTPIGPSELVHWYSFVDYLRQRPFQYPCNSVYARLYDARSGFRSLLTFH